MDRKRLILLTFGILFGLLVGMLILDHTPQLAQASPPVYNPNVALGQPGLSFAYTDTLGTTGVPYLYDHEHLYTPQGLGAFGDQIWIVEYRGERVLKFNSDGSYAGVELGGAGTPADFSWLTDVTIDADGNAWVANAFGSLVSVFDADGNFIKSLGGNGEFFNPSSVAFDSQGNIYIADGSMPFPFPNGNHRIEIYSSSDEYINTIGVTGESGADNEHFSNPHLIAIDGSDRLYVADSFNHRVQIFDVSEPLTPTYAATLGITGACDSDNDHLCKPMGVAVDDSFIYVADTDNKRVQIFDIDTRVYVATITSDCENTGCAEDVAVDGDGNIYVTEDGKSRVQQYDSARNFVRSYGTTDVPYLTDGEHFYWLASLASTPDQGLLVLEWGGNRLVKLDAQGDLQWTMGKAGITGCGDLYDLCFPDDVAADTQGNVYLANGYIRIYDPDGIYIDAIGSFNDPGAGEYQFNNPTGVAVAADGTVYVADSGNQRVQVYDSDWIYFDTIGETGVPGDDTVHFNEPTDVVVDSLGNIYVADQGNYRVQVFDATLEYLRTVGEQGDNFGQFQDGMQLAVDAQSRLYVVDDSGHAQVFDASGAFLTSIAGEFQGGVTIDSSGKLYLARGNDYDIQVFSPGVPGWMQVNINGFGDRGSGGVSSLGYFKGQLYAASSKWGDPAGAVVWRLEADGSWSAVSEPGFGSQLSSNNAISDLTVFDGQIYASTSWSGNPGQIWRSADGVTWEAVDENGLGDPSNIGIYNLIVYDDLLYAGTSNNNGFQVWRSPGGDSLSWTNVLTEGLGITSTAVTGFAEFDGMLYAAVENNQGDSQDGMASVFRSADGETWEAVVTDGFGQPGDWSTGGMVVFKGGLYVGLLDPDGAQIWMTENGSDWSAVMSDGFGNPENFKVESLVVKTDRLYAGTNNVSGLEIWSSTDGETWELFLQAGFGDSYNYATLWSSATLVFNGSLYYGTWNGGNGGEVWQFLQYYNLIPLIVK